MARETGDIGRVYRCLPEYHYRAVWEDNKTVRFCPKGEDPTLLELPPNQCEFYDVGINTKCNAMCEFCYVSAEKGGENYLGICEAWREFSKTWYRRNIAGVIATNAPVLIAIGSTGEPTIHPEFIEFLKTVRGTKVIPNYTTNGLILGYCGSDQEKIKERDNLLEATEKYCSAVAVSLGNKSIREVALRAIENLIPRDVYVVTHHIISNKESVDEFLKFRDKYGDKIYYYTLLPLAKSGRSKEEMSMEVYEYLETELLKKRLAGESIGNISFGAKFIPFVRAHGNILGASLVPEGYYSKNIILKKDKVIITPSSFDLTPIMTVKL